MLLLLEMSSDYSEPIIPDDAELDDDVSQGPTKRIRKLTSKVWDDFVKFKGPSGNDIARWFDNELNKVVAIKVIDLEES
ncbi:unnamed protein product [Camellia sinensis]